MTDVFISYARADRERVRLIAHALAAEGFSVWWDPEIKSDKTHTPIATRVLAQAAAVMTCWSPRSVKSDAVATEAHQAHARKTLTAAVLKPCQPPIPFNALPAADLTQWRGEPDDPNWRALLADIQVLVDAKRGAVSAQAQDERVVRGPGYARGYSPDYRLAAEFDRADSKLVPFAFGVMTALIVLTTGILASPYVATQLGKQQQQQPVAAAPAAVAPLEAPAVIAPPEPASAPAPEPEPEPEAAAPARVEPAAAPPSAPAPAASPAPAPSPAATPALSASAAAQGELEGCAFRWVEACPAGGGRRPPGFVSDGRVSEGERRFLERLGLTLSPAPAPADVAGICARRSGADFIRACQGTSWAGSAQ